MTKKTNFSLCALVALMFFQSATSVAQTGRQKKQTSVASGNVSLASNIPAETSRKGASILKARTTTISIPQVQNLKVIEVTTTTAKLYWEPPFNLDLSYITGFEIYKNGVLYRSIPSTLASPLNYRWEEIVSGLYEGSTYTFSIKALLIPSIAVTPSTNYTTDYPSVVVKTPSASSSGSYCIPYNNGQWYAQMTGAVIGKVQLNTINNVSTIGNPLQNYTDYSNIRTTVVKGSSYTLNVLASNLATPKKQSYVVWIDYNKNFRFEEDEIVMFKNLTLESPATITVTIPAKALNGSTRMRVQISDTEASYMGPCEPIANTVYGETEDYTLDIVSSTAEIPTAPANLTASNITNTSLTLNWSPSKDDVAVTGYDVYRNGTLFTTVATCTASITGLAQGVAYSFYVKAKDGAGNVSEASNTVAVTMPKASDTQAPTAPTALTTRSTTATSLTLAWTASKDNRGVTGYDVYRNGVLLITVPTCAASVAGLAKGTAYTFYVKAKDAAGNVSAASNTITVKTSSTKKLVDDGGETSVAAKIVVYPNPADEKLFVSDIERVEHIYIFNSFGKQIYTSKATKQIDVSNLASGMYVISLKLNDGSIETFKFIKK